MALAKYEVWTVTFSQVAKERWRLPDGSMGLSLRRSLWLHTSNLRKKEIPRQLTDGAAFHVKETKTPRVPRPVVIDS